MKVLHIFHNYGAFIKNQIIEENRLGICSKGIYYSLNKSNIASADTSIISVIKGDSRLKGNFTLQYRLNSIWSQLKVAIEKEKPDIIHAHISSVDGQLALRIKREYGIPYVTAIRNTDINNSYIKNRKNRNRVIEVWKEASKIYLLCGSYIERLKMILSSESLEVIYPKIRLTANGVDSFWINAAKVSKSNNIECINIVTAGDICMNKGQLYTSLAIKRLIKKGYNIKYTIIGKNKNMVLFKFLSRFSFVDIMPFAPKEELCKIYDLATIFVLVSKYETFGIVYPEAMSRGVPIVYNCNEGFGGRYPEGVVGYSVQYGDISGLQQCIINAIQKHDEISNSCVNEISKYSWETIGLEYISDYKDIAM